MTALKLFDPHGILSASGSQAAVHPAFTSQERITLRAFYERVMLPQIRDWQSPNSLKEDRTALNHWEQVFPDLDIRQLTTSHCQRFASYLTDSLLSPASINKTWRELKPMMAYACECGIIDVVPTLGYRRRSKLVKEPPKKQREPVTLDELTRLWRACDHATYPRNQEFPTPRYWRVSLVLFWMYGPRTLDLFRDLVWDDIRSPSRRILFQATKTSKLQGLPLTDPVLAHLNSIRGTSRRVFSGFNTPGFQQADGGWKRGYYTTWRNEICAAARIDPPITFKNLRETMLTRYNAVDPGLGDWIAGHYVPGVSAQHYDLPTERIRAAVESTPVPDCFLEVERDRQLRLF